MYRVSNEIWCPFLSLGNPAHYFFGDPVCFCSNIQLIGQRNVSKATVDGVYLGRNLHFLEVICPFGLGVTLQIQFLYDPFSRTPNSMKIFNESKARQTELEVEHRNKLIVRQKVKDTRLERCSVISSHKDPTIPTSKWTCKASQDLLQRSRKVCIRNISNQTNNIWYVIHYDNCILNLYILGKI